MSVRKSERDIVYLRHILDSTNRIALYLKGITEQEFEHNEMLQDAVIRQIEIIGEATGRISEDLQKVYPDVPWQKAIGMRNKLIHDYLGVDIRVVWLTATTDLPPFRQHIVGILKDHGYEIE